MNYNDLSNEDMKSIFSLSKTIAIVGLSSKPDRASYRIGDYLQRKDYKIYPVNPMEREVLGEKSYNDLRSLPVIPDIVDVFRNSDSVMPIVDECIELGIKTIWFQLGVINKEAINKAKENNITVIVDKCIMVEHRIFA